MASIDKIVKQKIKLLEETPNKLIDESKRVELKVWKQLLPLIKELEVDSKTGSIIQSDSNINKIASITDAFNKYLAGDEYRVAIKNFLNAIDKNVKLTNDIAREIEKGFEPTEAQTRLIQITKQNAIDAFVGSGLKNNVTRPFLEQLTANIASGATLTDAVNSLEKIIIGDKENDGRLLANTKTIAKTAQTIANSSYNAAIYEYLNIEWFRYVGGEIPTTREFCRNREGGIFHKKEIEMWGEGKNSAGIDDIEDGTWSGRIDGTNEKTIFVNKGGWECRHEFVPINKEQIPDEIIQRVRNEGFIE
jgi:hypothetical protein